MNDAYEYPMHAVPYQIHLLTHTMKWKFKITQKKEEGEEEERTY